MAIEKIFQYRRDVIMLRTIFELSIAKIAESISHYQRKRKDKDLFKKTIRSSQKENIEPMENVVMSIFKSKELYDELKVRCHPDRFLDKEQNAIATTLFQDLTKNKANYQTLCSIKERATKELGINRN